MVDSEYTSGELGRQMAAPRRSVADLFGVPTVQRNARDRLVQTAVELFYRHGFHSVGLDRILAETGVTKTTFYKHFESRDDLIIEAIRMRDDWETQAWRRAINLIAGRDPRARLLGFFDVLDLWFNDPDFHGCMFINTTVQFPEPNDPAHQAAAAHKRRFRDEIRDLAAEAGAAAPEVFADLYIVLFEGTLILRQSHGRNDAAKVARPAVAALIDQHIPRSPVTKL